MRLATALIAITTVLGCNSGHVFAQDAGTKTPLIEIKGTGVKIEVPEGFEKATAFNGFQQESTGSSVLVTVIPGPYPAVIKGFTKKAMAVQGIQLLSKKNIKLGGEKGLLLNVSQDAHGQTFKKWIAVFGDKSKTTMVAATFPASNADLNKSLRKSVMSIVPVATLSDKPSLPFELDDVEGLSLVESMAAMGKMAAFTKNGTIPLTKKSDPLFVAGSSLGNVPTGETKAYAIQRLHKTAGTKVDEILNVTDITIDGLSGIEIEAVGHLSNSDQKVDLYQVMLFPPEGGYYLMTGRVSQDASETFIPKFKLLAKSWKLLAKESD